MFFFYEKVVDIGQSKRGERLKERNRKHDVHAQNQKHSEGNSRQTNHMVRPSTIMAVASQDAASSSPCYNGGGRSLEDFKRALFQIRRCCFSTCPSNRYVEAAERNVERRFVPHVHKGCETAERKSCQRLVRISASPCSLSVREAEKVNRGCDDKPRMGVASLKPNESPAAPS